MKEFQAIIKGYYQTDFTKRKAALATVVQVRGSSYRSPGARMLITDDGRWIGSISGGCLEGDALRKARQVMADKKSITITYDTREESNQSLGIGLGCNGVIDVLIEAVDNENPQNPIKIFERITGFEEPVAIATVFSSTDINGEKFITSQRGEIIHSSDEDFNLLVSADLQHLFLTKKCEAKQYAFKNETIGVFIELVQPPITVFIFGAGFDARPVSELAKNLGWNVTVTDECVAHIAPVFFPTADKLSLCHRDFIDRDFHITPYTACVLMSHNYEYDRDVLQKLLNSPAPYIGILGPRKRFDKMIDELSKNGMNISPDDMHRVHSPIGLDIGAETPDEIALSIIAEIQSKFANRSGGFLKYRNAPIHQRDQKSDQVLKQVYLNNQSDSRTATGNP